MENTNLLDQLSDTIARLRSSRCEARLDLINKFKASFGNKFDDLDFFNYETGGFVKGADLRDAQTGCEIFQIQGWDRSPDFGHEIFKCGCIQYDEQLRFVSPEGEALSNTDYRVTLTDGRTVSGTTDSGGKTKRIKNTNKEQAIEKVQFFSSQRTQPLCPKNATRSGKCVKEVELSGVTTTPENVGSSVKTVTVEGTARPLTSGEIAMARLVFKDSIDYSKVKVHKEEYLPFGLQDDHTAMTPNGEMYFNPEQGFKEDFSVEGPRFKIWFIHEMSHVWQYQLGYWVKLHGAALAVGGGYLGGGAYDYNSPDNKNKTFPDFNMEQQGDIIAHYFAAKFSHDKDWLPELPFYEHILKDFVRNPNNANLLPK